MEEDEYSYDELDPRIQIELEKLNSSTDVINKLEQDLDFSRSEFRALLSQSTKKLDQLSREIGPSVVERSRSYYDARMVARRAHCEAQQAASRYEKASGALEAAKEMVNLAEEGYQEKNTKEFDLAWQEMLNHATNRVNESERDKIASAFEHRKKSKAFAIAEARVQALEKSMKRSIKKSRPYFEVKAKYNHMLDDQKRQVQLIEETIKMTKLGYSNSLKELEKISEEIHEKRNQRKEKMKEMGPREDGVGAEETEVPNSKDHESPLSHKPSKCLTLDLRIMKHSKFLKDKEFSTSQASVNSSNTSSSAASPVRTPSYEQLLNNNENDDENVENIGKEWKHNNSSSNSTRMYLSPNPDYNEDDLSDVESLASMDVLDDEMIENLMLNDRETKLKHYPGSSNGTTKSNDVAITKSE